MKWLAAGERSAAPVYDLAQDASRSIDALADHLVGCERYFARSAPAAPRQRAAMEKERAREAGEIPWD